MVAEINECDRHRLQQLLDDDLSMAEAEQTHQHLGLCDSCRAALESLAADQQVWGDMPRYLQRDESDPAVPLTQVTQSVFSTTVMMPAIEMVLERLAESENPAMLGRLGEYDILEVVGAGGMGVVLKGYDRQLNRFVAIKVLAPHYASNAAARTRFAREAKAAAAVVHPHVVSIHGVADGESLPYFIMQYVPGQSLQQRIESAAPMDMKDVLRIGVQTARGLAAAHAQGLVHRDIKPANILLENGVERVLISDFGLARAADDASMTQSGVIAGTPQFMSPEQARGEPIDGRSDLFSLGSVLYAMCTGHSPFRAETTVGVLSRIYNETPRPVRKVNSDVPDFLAGILDRLLAKDPAERFQTADETAKSLGDWLAHVQQPDVVPRPVWPPAPNALADRFPPSRVRRVLLSACGGFFIVLATILVVLELNKGTLEIQCDAQVPIRIMHGEKVYDEVTITPTKNSVRIAAGHYVVQLDGDFQNLEVENGGDVTIAKRDRKTVRIIHRPTGPPKLDDKTGVHEQANAMPDMPEKITTKDELQKWQGIWTVVRYSGLVGEEHPIDDLKVEGDSIWLRGHNFGQLPFSSLTPDRLVLDGSKSPAHFTFERKVPIWGIYELNERGDRMKIRHRKSDSPLADVRPADFDGESQHTVLYTLQKAPSSLAMEDPRGDGHENVNEPVFQGKTWGAWLDQVRADPTDYVAHNALSALRVDASKPRVESALREWVTSINRERDPERLAQQILILGLLAGEDYTNEALDVVMSVISRQPERGNLSIYEPVNSARNLLWSARHAMARLNEEEVVARMAKETEHGNSQARHFALAFCDAVSSQGFAASKMPITALLPACDDKNLIVRRRAIAKLARLHPKQDETRARLRKALDDPNEMIARDAAVFLSTIDPNDDQLLARLKVSANSSDFFKQFMATKSLLNAAAENPQAFKALIELLDDPKWGNTVFSIEDHRTQQHQVWDQMVLPTIEREVIRRFASSQNNQYARRTAILGLGRLFPMQSDQDEIEASDQQKQAMEVLQIHLKHKNKELRFAAGQAIEMITGQEVNLQ